MLMFIRVLFTECLKLKRTLAFWMVLVAPLVTVALEFLVSCKSARVSIHDGKDAWGFLARQTVQVWAILMMPLFVTLETSLLAGLENTGKNWKSLLALPAPRWTVYFSKLTVTIVLLWLAHAVLVAGTLANGMALHLMFPALRLGSMPLAPFVASMATVSAAALLGVAIQHWVSLRWNSYPVAMGFGMCAMTIGVFGANSPAIGPWFPWSLPVLAALGGAAGGGRITIVAIGGAIFAACAGCWEFARREIA